MRRQKFQSGAIVATNSKLQIFWNSDHRHTSIFIKAVVFNHVGLSWMILNKDQYEFSVEQKFIEWCTGVPWFHNTIFRNLHGPIFEELFFTARQDMYVLMCGLHAYDKENYQSTGATNFGGGRPIPNDSTTITPSFTQIAPWRGRGCASWGRRNQQPCISAAARGHGTEGQPSYPGPLATGDRQCSQHTCREHWRPDAQDEGPREVPPRGRTREKEDVSRGLPPAASEFLPLCCLGGQADGGGSHR